MKILIVFNILMKTQNDFNISNKYFTCFYFFRINFKNFCFVAKNSSMKFFKFLIRIIMWTIKFQRIYTFWNNLRIRTKTIIFWFSLLKNVKSKFRLFVSKIVFCKLKNFLIFLLLTLTYMLILRNCEIMFNNCDKNWNK